MRTSAVYIEECPEFGQLVKSLQELYEVRVGMAHYNPRAEQLELTTDSEIKGLDIFRFQIKKESVEDDLLGHLKTLEKKSDEARLFAKSCMLAYLVNKNPNLEFSPQYEILLKLVSDKSVSRKTFENYMKERFSYEPEPTIVQREIVEPVIFVRGKGRGKDFVAGPLIKKTVEKAFPTDVDDVPIKNPENFLDWIRYRKTFETDVAEDPERVEFNLFAMQARLESTLGRETPEEPPYF